jgi:regulator of RNase E activity RraA
VVPGSRLAGRVCPARHTGSVDAFLEAFEMAAPGDVQVVDNGGLLDEACVGDLVALKAHAADMEGMVIWGLRRDTADIRAIGLPVFSLGAIPTSLMRSCSRNTAWGAGSQRLEWYAASLASERGFQTVSNTTATDVKR